MESKASNTNSCNVKQAMLSRAYASLFVFRYIPYYWHILFCIEIYDLKYKEIVFF